MPRDHREPRSHALKAQQSPKEEKATHQLAARGGILAMSTLPIGESERLTVSLGALPCQFLCGDFS
jgi:hypothetical protein